MRMQPRGSHEGAVRAPLIDDDEFGSSLTDAGVSMADGWVRDSKIGRLTASYDDPRLIERDAGVGTIRSKYEGDRHSLRFSSLYSQD